MAVNQTTLGDLLMRVYDKGTITTLQNLEVPFLSHLGEASDYTLGGEGFFFPVNASGDEGYAFVDENSPLPTPQNEQVKQAKVSPTVFAGAVRITGLGRAISARDPFSFANGLQYALDEKLRRMTVYCEGALFRDGTGLLAQVNDASIGNTTSVALPIDTPGSMWLRRNQIIDFKQPSATGDVTVATAKITDVDHVGGGAGPTILLDKDISSLIADNGRLYLSQSQPAASILPREYVGLDGAVANTGTYLNIDRALVPEWEGNVIDAGSTDLDEDRLLQAENRCLIVGGVASSEIRNMRMICHPNQRRKYFEVVVPQKQFTGLNLDAGYDKLTWNGKEMLETYNCPEDVIYMGNLGMFHKFTAPEGELKIDTTFGPPIKWANGFDAGLAYFRSYCAYAVRKPNSFVRINNLNNVALNAR